MLFCFESVELSGIYSFEFSVSDGQELMKWLFDIVADIARQRFTNLMFCCGRLCPHVSCLKHEVEEAGHIDIEQYNLPELLDLPEIKKLRQGGQPTVKCLQHLRLPEAKKNALLSMAYSISHVEESYIYVEGHCDHHELGICSFSDSYDILAQEAVNQDFANGSQLGMNVAPPGGTGMPNIHPYILTVHMYMYIHPSIHACILYIHKYRQTDLTLRTHVMSTALSISGID